MFWIWHALMNTARMVGGPSYLKTIEEIDGELTRVVEDFMRAVDVETLRLAKRSGEHPLSQPGDNAFSVTFRRPKRARERGSRAFETAASTREDWLSPRPPLYGRHPQSRPQGNHGLGGRCIKAGCCSPWQYILDLRLTWNWQNVIGAFDLRKP